MHRTRTIEYKNSERCPVCGKSDILVRTDEPEDSNPMHQVYGPGNDDYGRNPIPPAPIPPPNPSLTNVVCKSCGNDFTIDTVNDLKVVSDSEQERYDFLLEAARKRH